jgi:hypothetical protein
MLRGYGYVVGQDLEFNRYLFFAREVNFVSVLREQFHYCRVKIAGFTPRVPKSMLGTQWGMAQPHKVSNLQIFYVAYVLSTWYKLLCILLRTHIQDVLLYFMRYTVNVFSKVAK